MDNLYEQAKYEYNSISDKEKQEITEEEKNKVEDLLNQLNL